MVVKVLLALLGMLVVTAVVIYVVAPRQRPPARPSPAGAATTARPPVDFAASPSVAAAPAPTVVPSRFVQFASELYALTIKGARLPAPDETSDGLNYYSLGVEGRSVSFTIRRSNRLFWMMGIGVTGADVLSPSDFGTTRLLCNEPGAPGYGANIYGVESGPLAGNLVELQFHGGPGADQAILCTPTYARLAEDLSKAWAACRGSLPAR